MFRRLEKKLNQIFFVNWPVSKKLKLKFNDHFKTYFVSSSVFFSSGGYFGPFVHPILATSNQCYNRFTGMYLQVCKNRPIFKIICSHKCCLIQEYHAFLVKNLMKTDVSILNLTTHGALINFKSFYRLVKPGLQNGYSIGYWFSFGWSSILSFPHRMAAMTGARQPSGLQCWSLLTTDHPTWGRSKYDEDWPSGSNCK